MVIYYQIGTVIVFFGIIMGLTKWALKNTKKGD